MKRRALLAVTIGIGVVNVVMGLGFVVLAIRNGKTAAVILSDPGWLLALSMTAIAVPIILRRPANPLGWIFAAVGFFQGLVAFAHDYAVYGLITAPGSLPAALLMSWLGNVAWLPGLALMLTYAVLLFPTGTLPSRRWRFLAWLSAGPILIFLPLSLFLWPYRGVFLLESIDQVPEPEGWMAVASSLFLPLLLLCAGACLVSLVVRYRTGAGVERQQIRWVVFAFGLFLLAIVLLWFTPLGLALDESGLQFVLTIPVTLAIPAAVGIAILRYRLWEIDILINRTLVYVPLTAILAGLYSATLSLLEDLFSSLTGAESDEAVILTTLVLVSAFTPVKNGIQGFVDKRYKDPREPLEALKAYGRQIQAVVEVIDPPRAARRLLAESIDAMQAMSGAVFLATDGDLRAVATSGPWRDGSAVLIIPIEGRGAPVGELHLGPRRKTRPYTAAEIGVLTELSASLGAVLSGTSSG